MKTNKTITLFFLLTVLPGFCLAEGYWPKEISLKNGKVIIYQPQTDSMKGDHLYSRVAVSLTTESVTDPVFGAIWTDSKFSTDRTTGNCTIYDVKILNMRFPGIDTINAAKVKQFRQLLETEASGWALEFSMEELKSSLAMAKAAAAVSSGLKNDPPEIIFRKEKTLLVTFDGEPVWKESGTDGLKRAINTPFLVLNDLKEASFYLYGDPSWYVSRDPVKSAWSVVAKPSAPVQKYFDALKKEMERQASAGKPSQKPADSKASKAPAIVARTTPAELIQSEGEPQYAPIEGTGLLYMTNSGDNIFMTTDNNTYYVLLSGRWYRSASLSGPWAYTEADRLPADFAKIPEGSAKDLVLASVAGTPAAKEALLDAQIPQTSAVDRATAKCTVKWDGDPKFEKIKGTELARGMNTASTVLLYKNVYYVCDNAVWFTGKSPAGPWEVATSVPDEIQKIPPEDPAYNVKYVYIYDVRPEVVYVGYTPGYTGCYIYGPTVVYGTGYPYVPFYGPYYYPRPVTYGFSMHYNPWYGWSMGFSVSYGMFTFSMGGMHGYPGGWWGPPMYRPPYPPHYNHYYGPRPPVYRGGGNTININNNNNIYVNRPDRSTKPARQPSVSGRPATSDRPGTRPATTPATRPGTREAMPADRSSGRNNVYTDRNGDIYRNNNGEWQKNNGKKWESTTPSTQQNREERAQPRGQERGNFNSQEMNRQSQARERGNMNTTNRSNAQRQAPGSGGARRR